MRACVKRYNFVHFAEKICCLCRKLVYGLTLSTDGNCEIDFHRAVFYRKEKGFMFFWALGVASLFYWKVFADLPSGQHKCLAVWKKTSVLTGKRNLSKSESSSSGSLRVIQHHGVDWRKLWACFPPGVFDGSDLLQYSFKLSPWCSGSIFVSHCHQSDWIIANSGFFSSYRPSRFNDLLVL